MPDESLVRGAADLLIQYNFEPWFYGDSVGLEGLVCAAHLLGDDYYEGFVHGMGRGALARDGVLRPMDNTFPGKVMTEVAQRRGDERLIERMRQLLEQLDQRETLLGVPVSLTIAALREPYGGAALSDRDRELLLDPGPAVYVDCLHFEPPFYASLGTCLGDQAMVDKGIALAEAFASMLQGSTGLFDHFYLERTGATYIPGWTRGQGWAAMGLLDVIETVGVDDPRVLRLQESLSRLADAMVLTQLPTGHWGSLAQQDSPVETSAAAFMAAVFMRMDRLGLSRDTLRQSADRAFDATISSVDETGWLRGVSATVWSSTEIDHYNHVPVDFMVPWSQGPLLMALYEKSVATSEQGRSS